MMKSGGCAYGMPMFSQHQPSNGGVVDETFSLSDLDHNPTNHHPHTNHPLAQSQQSLTSTINSHASSHRPAPRTLAADLVQPLPSAILASQPVSSSSSFQEQLQKTVSHLNHSASMASHHPPAPPRVQPGTLHVQVHADDKENASWNHFSNAATPVVMPLQPHHFNSTFSIDSLANQVPSHPNQSTYQHHPAPHTNVPPSNPSTSTSVLQNKWQRDIQQQQQHKQYEYVLKQELEHAKLSALEQSLLNEEKLRQELLHQKKQLEDLMLEKENSYQKQLQEKEQHIQSLQQQITNQKIETREALQHKDQEYIQLMQSQEDKHKQQLQQVIQSHQEQLQKIQLQLHKDEESRKVTEKARIEAKERSVVEVYEKKLKKYAKKVDQVVKEYHVKELKLQGALEEARREILHLTATYDAKESLAREELLLKDKKLIQIQQRLDSVDEIDQVAKTWKESARDLASMVIRTCATVEDLPAELWSSTTPGLFTSVWDDLQKLRTNTQPLSASSGTSYQEDLIQSYARKKKECVVANRNLMAKCLKYSKMVHERIKSEVTAQNGNNATSTLS